MSAMDMIAKLVLDSADYESSLNEAVADTKKFKDETERTSGKLRQLEKDGGNTQRVIQSLGKSMGWSDKKTLTFSTNIMKATKILGGVAAAAGAAVAVFNTYDAIMKSNAITSNEWKSTMEAFPEVIDSFFTALATGDWDVFNNGILNAIRLSKQYRQALRDLENDLKIGDTKVSEYEKNLNYWENYATNPNNTKEEKEKGYKRFNEEYNQAVPYVEKMSKSVNDKFKKMFEGKGVNIDDMDVRKDILDYFASFTDSGKRLRKYIETLNEISGLDDSIRLNAQEGISSPGLEDKRKLYVDEKNRMLKEDPKLKEMYKAFANFGEGEELDMVLDLSDKITGYEDRAESLKRQKISLDANFDKNGNFIETKTPPKKVNTPKVTQPDLSKIKYNENGGIVIDIVPILDSQKSLPQLEGDLKRLKDQLSNAKTADEYVQIKAKVDEKEQQIDDFKSGKPIKEQYQIDYENNLPNMNDLFADQNNAAIEFGNTVSEQYAKIQKDSKEAWEKMQEGAKNTSIAVSGVGDMFSALGGAVGGSAGEMLEFAGQTAQAVAQMIPQIVSLIGAKQAEAMASGTASAAALPFPANIGAIASIIATIVGLFASFPKFANGGIISGPTSMGDYNLARVNGGEMILNQTQQGRLFRTLNQGGAIKSGPTSVEREWRIEGSTLVGVIKNYSAVQNKLGKKIF